MDKNIVKVSNKTFRVLYTAEEIQKRVEKLALQLKADYAGKNPLFICMLNGSYVFTADLLRLYGEPCEVRFVRLSSYVGTQSTGNVRNVLGLDVDIKGRDVVVVEDIVETGHTMKSFIDDLMHHLPASVSVASLVTKPACLAENVEVKYVGFEMEASAFIVGYGMDYDEGGRNLPDIYIVEE